MVTVGAREREVPGDGRMVAGKRATVRPLPGAIPRRVPVADSPRSRRSRG
jgi:hypothetical protein